MELSSFTIQQVALADQEKTRGLNPQLSVVAVLLALLVAQSFLQRFMLDLTPVAVTVTTDGGQKRSARAWRVLSMGRVSAVVDWLLIRVLTDERTHWVRRGEHPKVFYDLQLATELDPWGPDLYLLAGRLLAVIRNDPQGAHALLSRGLEFRADGAQRLPSSELQKAWQLHWQLLLALFYVEVYELQAFSRVSALVKEIRSIPGAPAWFGAFDQKLSVPGHLERMGLRVIDSMLEQARDEREKRELLFKRARLLETLEGRTGKR